jgi:hypothetical protein
MTETKSARFSHMLFEIDWALQLSAEDFQKTYPKNTEATRARLIEDKKRGLTYIPYCDHTDAKTGECLGHEEKAAEISQ